MRNTTQKACDTLYSLHRWITKTRQRVILVGITVFILFLVYNLRSSGSGIERLDNSGSDNIRVPTASFRLIPLNASPRENTRDGKSIPRIIHQTWKTQDSLPETFRLWMESWLNVNGKSWQYWFWTDADMRRFIEVAFPRYLSFYDSYPNQGYRADAFRYFVLYHYGGLYADLDMECLKPLDPFFNRYSCIVSQEPLEHAHFLSNRAPPLISNALMACREGHPFFAYVLESLRSYTGIFTWTHILHATGPGMLTDLYNRYHLQASLDNKVDLAEPNIFQPAVDSSMVDHMRERCRTAADQGKGTLETRLCQRLIAHDFGRTTHPSAITTHHWTHTWAGQSADPWGLSNMRTRFDVGQLRHNMHAVNVSEKV